MPQFLAHLTGIAGVSLFLANFAPAALDTSGAMAPGSDMAAGSLHVVNRAAKADRSALPASTQRPAAVSTVEVVGVGQATIILRDRLGTILYRSDPLANTTLVSKGADIPIITVKETTESPTVSRSVPAPHSKDGAESKERRGILPGCQGVVSSLVNHELRRVPSLCLAMAEGRRQL